MATPFPTYGDAVDVAQLQAAVTSVLASHVKSGNAATTVASLAAGSGAGPFAVSFNSPFATAPRVTVSSGSAPGGSQYLVPRVTGVTASGFSIYVYNVGTGTSTATLSVTWVATDLGND